MTSNNTNTNTVPTQAITIAMKTPCAPTQLRASLVPVSQATMEMVYPALISMNARIQETTTAVQTPGVTILKEALLAHAKLVL